MRSHVAPPTPPICQKRKVSMASTRGSMRALTRDMKAADAAAPARASLSGVATAAAERADRVDEDGGARSARDRETHHGVRRRDAEERDADDDRERGAAGDAEDARIGERVARDGLHRRCPRSRAPRPRGSRGRCGASGRRPLPCSTCRHLAAEPREDVVETRPARTPKAIDATHSTARAAIDARQPREAHRRRAPQDCGARRRRASQR